VSIDVFDEDGRGPKQNYYHRAGAVRKESCFLVKVAASAHLRIAVILNFKNAYDSQNGLSDEEQRVTSAKGFL
jgi:hypothetical protein